MGTGSLSAAPCCQRWVGEITLFIRRSSAAFVQSYTYFSFCGCVMVGKVKQYFHGHSIFLRQRDLLALDIHCAVFYVEAHLVKISFSLKYMFLTES